MRAASERILRAPASARGGRRVPVFVSITGVEVIPTTGSMNGHSTSLADGTSIPFCGSSKLTCQSGSMDFPSASKAYTLSRSVATKHYVVRSLTRNLNAGRQRLGVDIAFGSQREHLSKLFGVYVAGIRYWFSRLAPVRALLLLRGRNLPYVDAGMLPQSRGGNPKIARLESRDAPGQETGRGASSACLLASHRGQARVILVPCIPYLRRPAPLVR